jgi:hypothetical protein
MGGHSLVVVVVVAERDISLVNSQVGRGVAAYKGWSDG